MRFKDFDLKLYGGQAEGYHVEVINSPVRRRGAALPLLLPKGAAALLSEGRVWWPADAAASRSLGEALFGALFRGPTLGLWERSEEALGAQDVLRLRLDVRSHELACLPWELLHDGSYHLALSPKRPVVRFSFGLPDADPAESVERLNVLLAVSTPRDAPHLPAVEQELRLAREWLGGLQDAGKVGRVEVMRAASVERLQRELRQPFHVLHYVGHGEFVDDAGFLVLEDEAGRARRVGAETLGYFLRDTSVRLLFLNACRTAAASAGGATLGVAQAALAAGVPAVLAMQAVVRDDAAARFAHEFYGTLAEMRPLEMCVAEGRKAVMSSLPAGNTDWAVPVLFSNAREGLLWKSHAARAETAAPPAETRADRPPASEYSVQVSGVEAETFVTQSGKSNKYIGGVTVNNYEAGPRKRKKFKRDES